MDLVIFAVKTYDNATAIPLLAPLVGPRHGGADAAERRRQRRPGGGGVGEAHVLGGTTYVATALEAPGRIVQTGVHRSIIFGEAFGARRGRLAAGRRRSPT